MSLNSAKNKTYIEKARKVYGQKYNYDKLDITNVRTKATINCPKHGDFIQRFDGR